MTLDIVGIPYYTLSDVSEILGITRQTLWRWRQKKKIPMGLKYRGTYIVFTEKELIEIRAYMNRLEPILK